jgi:hypothetical protein
VVASLCGMASEVSHLAAPRNGIVPENSLPTLAWRPAGQGRASGPGETSEAARPAEPLRRRTSMRDRSLSVLLHVAAPTSFLILGEQAQRLTSDMESSEESVAPKGIEPTNSAVLERDTHDWHGQQRRMSGGGPRAAVRRTRTVITKKGDRPGAPVRTIAPASSTPAIWS